MFYDEFSITNNEANMSMKKDIHIVVTYIHVTKYSIYKAHGVRMHIVRT